MGSKGLEILVFLLGGDQLSNAVIKEEISKNYKSTMRVFGRIQNEKIN